jgi:hypothetical protein
MPRPENRSVTDATDAATALGRRIALKAELERTALLIAIAGSIANAHARGIRCRAPLATVPAYLAARHDLLAAVASFTTNDAIDSAVGPALGALHAKLVFARDIALIDVASTVVEIDATSLADAIRRLASLCFIVRNVVDRAVDPSGRMQNGEHRKNIDALLRSVSAGATPCLDRSGAVSVPGWAERRLDRRHRAAASVLVGTHRDVHWATVQNASATGLCLGDLPGLAVGETVTIHLRDRSMHAGRVVWSIDDQAGIALDVRLSTDALQALIEPDPAH